MWLDGSLEVAWEWLACWHFLTTPADFICKTLDQMSNKLLRTCEAVAKREDPGLHRCLTAHKARCQATEKGQD
jgi:hypothetical protein